MLYMATSHEPPRIETPQLRTEDVDSRRTAVRQWFSLPVVTFVGAHTGCSCGFPSFGADQPFEFYEGIFDERDEREADLASLRALLDLLRSLDGDVQLYAVWDGEEGEPPKGSLDLDPGAVDPARFFFIERFLYRATRAGVAARR